MLDILKKHFNGPLGKQLMFYGIYCSSLWLLHLALISIIAFFHFLLDHNIRTLGDWISDRGWALIIISKLLIFYLATLFINLKLSKLISWDVLLRNNYQALRSKFIVIFIFLILALMFAGNISINLGFLFSLIRSFFIVVGVFIFFGTDYLINFVLDHLYPIENKAYKWIKLIVFPTMFYFFTSMTFRYEMTVSMNIFSFYFLLTYLGEWKRKNWSYPLIVLLGFILPCYLIFGADPVWGTIYSPFISSYIKSFWFSFSLVVMCVMYLEYDAIKKPEYIYRD